MPVASQIMVEILYIESVAAFDAYGRRAQLCWQNLGWCAV